MKVAFIICLILFCGHLQAETVSTQFSRNQLLTKYNEILNKEVGLLQDELIHIHSDIQSERLKADIYAVKTYPFRKLVNKLSNPKSWCQFVALHLNIKACTFQKKEKYVLSFYAGRKFYEPAENAFELKYQFEIKDSKEDYFRLALSADDGPFSTSVYLIEVEVLKVRDDVLIHFSLSYNSSFTSRMGTSVYLSTIGRDKVGFSEIINEEGSSVYIKGVAGIIERNVMRYYLSLKVYLGADSTAQNASVNMASQWFDETEKHYRQLHELDKKDYLLNKKKEFFQQNLMQIRLNAKQNVLDQSDSE